MCDMRVSVKVCDARTSMNVVASEIKIMVRGIVIDKISRTTLVQKRDIIALEPGKDNHRVRFEGYWGYKGYQEYYIVSTM